MDNIEISFKNYKKKQTIAEYVIIFFLSTIFLLLFSFWTSPFYKDWYGCDASFFSLVGRGITEGKIMYRDFYDLKGPYFFFIEAIGQFIHKGRIGVFLIQLPALFASAALVWNISRLFVNKTKSWFILAVFYIGHIATLWGGNTLEEFFLPFSLLALYLTLKLFKSKSRFEPDNFTKEVSLPPYYSIMLGMFFGIIAFAKISVGSTIIGIIAAIAFLLIQNKDWHRLFLFVLYILLGVLIAALPVILYFTYYGCLMEMIKCVFVIGFRRSQDFAETFNITWELKCSGAVFAFIFAATHIRKTRRSILTILLAISGATYILLHLGTPFYYYFTIVYPCLILALALFLEIYDPLLLFESPRQAVCLLLLAIYFIYYIPVSLSSVRTAMYDRSNDSYAQYRQNCEDIASMIPEFERDSVFSFLIDMQFYEITDIMPDNKYVVNLPFFIALDENTLDELTDYMTASPPKWVVTVPHLNLNIPEMSEIIERDYTCIYENEVGMLYLHN